MPDIVNWYLESLATFWSSALRIGLPQIVLLVLLACWLRRRCCEKSRRRCGRGWEGGEGRGRRPRYPGCGCTRGCCRYAARHEEATAEAPADATAES